MMCHYITVHFASPLLGLWLLQPCFWIFDVLRWVAQAGLEVKILLPQPPKCWAYRYVPVGLTVFF
jgi:hypothetical protein